MIKRGHEPGLGLWSIPGGRIEPGETDAGALAREMREETGLEVEVGPLLGRVRRPGPGEAVLDIRDYAVRVTGGTLRAGDDAAEARWVHPGEMDALEITEGLVEALAGWGVLGLPPPRPSPRLPGGGGFLTGRLPSPRSCLTRPSGSLEPDGA